MEFDVGFMAKAFFRILPALPITLCITICSVAIGFVLAVGILYVRINKVSWLAPIARGYVSFFRGTPLMLHIFLVYYGLPHYFDLVAASLGLSVRANAIPLLALVIVAFSLNCAAYISEILRSGVLAIGKGEIEAAQSLGMTPWQIMRRILLPQAMALSLPSLGSRVIGILHGSAQAFWISVIEVTGKANLVASSTYQFVEAFFAAALIYWITTWCIERIVGLLERRHRLITARGLA